MFPLWQITDPDHRSFTVCVTANMQILCKYYANTASMQILIDKHPERILLMIIQNIIKIKDQITHFKLYLKLYLIQTHNNQTTSSAFCWQINKCANTPNIDKLYLLFFYPIKCAKSIYQVLSNGRNIILWLVLILFSWTYRVTQLTGAVVLWVWSGGVDVSLGCFSYQADLSVAVIVVAGSPCAPLWDGS